MSKIKIIDSEYSDDTPNERLTLVIQSYDGFRRGITKNNYPRFIEQVKNRTKFIDDNFPNHKITQGTRFDLVENGIWKYDDLPVCIVCGESKVMPLREGGMSSCCSKTCSARLSCQKSVETNMQLRGVPHHSRDPSVREKTLTTIREKNPLANCPMDLPGAKEKAKRTNRENFGVDHHMKNGEIANGVIAKAKLHPNSPLNPTYRERKREQERQQGYSQYIKDSDSWGVLNDREQLLMMTDQMSMNDIASYLGVDKKTVANYLDIHGLEIDRYRFGNRSSGEISLENMIRSIYDGEVISSYRGIGKNVELDIYIPDLNIAFEYNGLYWHSINPATKDRITRNFHLDKTQIANEYGIRLIHVFEDEWLLRRKQVESKIASILGCYANKIHGRKTVPVILDYQSASVFLEDNHIQGKTKGFFYCGLMADEDLVAVMVFTRTRAGVELSRFATSCKVNGGFSKLLSFFQKNNLAIDRIVSFADRRWSEGQLYYTNGFELEKTLYPDYKYVVGNERKHKSNFSKTRMEKTLEHFDPSCTEWENAWNHRLYRIYDCGLLKFVKHLA